MQGRVKKLAHRKWCNNCRFSVMLGLHGCKKGPVYIFISSWTVKTLRLMHCHASTYWNAPHGKCMSLPIYRKNWIHDSVAMGHAELHKTIQMLHTKFWWNIMVPEQCKGVEWCKETCFRPPPHHLTTDKTHVVFHVSLVGSEETRRISPEACQCFPFYPIHHLHGSN